MSISPTKKIDELNTLTEGFMVPIMKRTDPFTGATLNGLGPDDFLRVQQGYGCPQCLAKFKTYLATCPACGFVRDVESDFQQTPDLWADHLRQRHMDDGPSAKPVDVDTFLDEVMKSKDIEHRRLK